MAVRIRDNDDPNNIFRGKKDCSQCKKTITVNKRKDATIKRGGDVTVHCSYCQTVNVITVA